MVTRRFSALLADCLNFSPRLKVLKSGRIWIWSLTLLKIKSTLFWAKVSLNPLVPSSSVNPCMATILLLLLIVQYHLRLLMIMHTWTRSILVSHLDFVVVSFRLSSVESFLYFFLPNYALQQEQFCSDGLCSWEDETGKAPGRGKQCAQQI